MTLASSLSVRVALKTLEAEGICSFELVSDDGALLPSYEPGAHIDVHVPGGPVRPYSLCGDTTNGHRYRIAVQREPGSRGGSIGMHERVSVGDVIQISTPRNLFAISPQASNHLLLAGGIGITPLLAMAQDLARRGQPFELHYATRTLARTAFAKELRDASFASRVHFHHVDGAPAQRLNLSSVLTSAPDGSHLYVCGPRGLMDAALSTARTIGWSESRLHWESFSPSPSAVDGGPSADSSFELQVGSDGRVVQVSAGQTAIQALASIGIVLPTSCEQGLCGTCLTGVLEGTPDHRDQYLTPEEQTACDQFLPCCSRAKSARLVLDL